MSVDSAMFSLSMHRYALLTVMSVAGEVDLDSAHLLTELAGRALRAGRSFGVLVMDLSEVTFFSAAGVRALLEIRQLVATNAGTLVVRAPSPVTRTVLVAARVIDHFWIDDGPSRHPS